ncbi:MAG: lysophospholipid acyltransferase family protein [bacterium]
MFAFIVQKTFLFLSKILFKLKIEGKENIPKTGSIIIAANHTSFADPVLIGSSIPRKVRYIAKKDLFKNFLFGKILLSLGVFPVSREGICKETFTTCFEILKKKSALLIFPEGTRSHDGEIHEGMLGIGMIAYMSETDIVPCYIKGSHKLLPTNSKKITFTPIKVIFGQKISIADFLKYSKNKETYQIITKKTMQAIIDLKNGELKK